MAGWNKGIGNHHFSIAGKYNAVSELRKQPISTSASMVRRIVELGDNLIDTLMDKVLDFAIREAGLTDIDKKALGSLLGNIVKKNKGILPDLTIGANTWNYSYSRFYTVTWHELTHSSHYSLLGPDIWKSYIYYILDYGCYGDGKAPDDKKGICDVGESWAYANERYCGKHFGITRQTCSSSEWFYDHYKKLDGLLYNGTLTRKQMYDCLITSDGQPCLTFDDYWAELCRQYPQIISVK